MTKQKQKKKKLNKKIIHNRTHGITPSPSRYDIKHLITELRIKERGKTHHESRGWWRW